MGSIVEIAVDGVETVLHDDLNNAEVNDNFMKYAKEIEGRLGNFIEFVWVFYEEKPTLMVVDEMGALNIGPGYPLPVNSKATEIYKEVSRRRGETWEGPPYIHGVAYLFKDLKID
jgi:hypothetical protein